MVSMSRIQELYWNSFIFQTLMLFPYRKPIGQKKRFYSNLPRISVKSIIIFCYLQFSIYLGMKLVCSAGSLLGS